MEANKLARYERSKHLHKYPQHSVDFIWFSDEKLFTVATPRNSKDDRIQPVSHGDCSGVCSWLYRNPFFGTRRKN